MLFHKKYAKCKFNLSITQVWSHRRIVQWEGATSPDDFRLIKPSNEKTQPTYKNKMYNNEILNLENITINIKLKATSLEKIKYSDRSNFPSLFNTQHGFTDEGV